MTQSTEWDFTDYIGKEYFEFKIQFAGVEHVARISREALEDHFNADKIGFQQAFEANVGRIGDMALARILRGEQNPVLGKSSDFG